ncbi:hypothetical protein [Aeromonas sp. QDB59]|nr:hypothetical protein [Aeromonas sp. QDB59]
MTEIAFNAELLIFQFVVGDDESVIPHLILLFSVLDGDRPF